MQSADVPYAARLDVEYVPSLKRLTTFFRPLLAIPIAILLILLLGGGSTTVVTERETGAVERTTQDSGRGIMGSIAIVTAAMIVVRRRYPRWWFDFAREATRFSARVGAYLALVTDEYPSTVEEQRVRLELDYPDVDRDLNRWLPLVKWLLAIPHYIVLIVLWIGVVLAVIVAWFAILLTGRYPRALFDYVVGVARWSLRVSAYAFLLLTDRYPPFSLR